MKTRFTIDVDGSPRTVVSVRETRTGDLNFHITSGGRTYNGATIGDLVAACEESSFEECEKHVSLHRSPKSRHVNMIKRTTKYSSREETSVQMTTGIKQENLFVPVFFRVCGDLSRDRYRLRQNCPDNLISLGGYNPRKDQIRFMVVCSQVDMQFPKDPEHPTNVAGINFQNFTMTLIWSYLNKPSHPQAIDFFLQTNPETGPIRGLDWFEIYNLYTDLNMTHAQEYFRTYGDQ